MTRSSKWRRRLDTLRTDGLERTSSMRTVHGPIGARVETDTGPTRLFCSNDYLGLANHPEIKAAMKAAIDEWGAGAGASRLVSGNLAVHTRLERASATFVGADEAVLFVSGYQANVGALFALTQPGDTLFCDALIHASLIDGARLSKADVQIYRHSDMDHLRTLLAACDSESVKLIVTDAVFSMDGDEAKLADIVTLAKTHHAAIYLDEAHAFGILGPGGAGLAVATGLGDDIDVRIATYSKALGVSGAFVAADTTTASLIRSRARSLLYTTAPPPAIAAAVLKSLEIVATADEARRRLRDNIHTFRAAALHRGLPLLRSDTPIQPIITGGNHRTVQISNALLDAGFFVSGIRPPTVPKGQGRLRVTLSAKHDAETINDLVEAIATTLEAIP